MFILKINYNWLYTSTKSRIKCHSRKKGKQNVNKINFHKNYNLNQQANNKFFKNVMFYNILQQIKPKN